MPDEARIWCGDSSHTVTELHDRSARLATAFHQAGVGSGDRVAIVMRNDSAFLEASLAASRLAAVPVPLNWHWTGDDLAHALANSGSRLAVVHTGLLEGVVAQAPTLTVVEV